MLRPLAEPEALWGSAGYWLVAGEAHIATLAVDPQQRNRGFGKLLLQTMLSDAQAHGGCAPPWKCAQATWWHSAFTPVLALRWWGAAKTITPTIMKTRC